MTADQINAAMGRVARESRGKMSMRDVDVELYAHGRPPVGRQRLRALEAGEAAFNTAHLDKLCVAYGIHPAEFLRRVAAALQDD